MTSNDPIFTHFTETVLDYDTVASSVVMKNDELHDALVDALIFDRNKPLSVLDLGCGTGHGMSLILNRFKNSRVIGIDFSSRMIEKCSSHLEQFSGRFELLQQDFTDMELGGPYDAVVSAVAIHNTSHPEKIDLFRRIFNALSPGGYFVNGDFVEGESTFLDQETKEVYKAYVQSRLKGDELRVWLKHIEEDKPMKLSEQYQVLATLGYESMRLKWLHANEAVYVAAKPLFHALSG